MPDKTEFLLSKCFFKVNNKDPWNCSCVDIVYFEQVFFHLEKHSWLCQNIYDEVFCKTIFAKKLSHRCLIWSWIHLWLDWSSGSTIKKSTSVLRKKIYPYVVSFISSICFTKKIVWYGRKTFLFYFFNIAIDTNVTWICNLLSLK